MTNLTRREFLNTSLATTAAAILPQPLQRATDSVVWLWSGALQPTSFAVNALINRDSSRVRLLASTRPDMQNAQASPFVTTNQAANNRVAALRVNGVRPDTFYYYAVETDGQLDSQRGSLQTPKVGAHSFTFAFASCAESGSNHPVFDTIRSHKPLFFMHMGDLHYFDIASNNRQIYRDAYYKVLKSPRQAALYRSTPIAYMWDDHDYGPNDSNGQFIGRTAARLSYQENTPHFPLVAGSGNVPIYQAFTIGRVRFIMTDTRSMRDTDGISADAPSKTMLGATQKAWLKRELLNAKQFPVCVWMCTSPWLADSPGSGIDNWNGFRAERREMANFIDQNDIRNLFYLSGDLHALALDDGTNNRYHDANRRGFPLMIAAALDRPGSFFSTNTYSGGQFPNGGQFGLMSITDNGGDDVRVRWSGRNADNREIISLEMHPPSVSSPPTTSTPNVPSGELSADQRELRIQTMEGATSPATATLQLSGNNIAWTAQLQPATSWLSFAPTSGTTPATITFTARPTGLRAGVYATSLQITDSARRKSIWLPIKLIVQPKSWTKI